MRNIILNESRAEYDAKAKEYLTSHQLADFRRCPLLYHKRQLGLIKPEDSPAFLIGRALHTLVLEGLETFNEHYAAGGPINPKTGNPYGANTKAAAKWAKEQGKEILTPQQMELIRCMANSVRGHASAVDLLQEGIAEGVVRNHYCDMPCQIRMDWFNPQAGIVELKTCDDLDYFETDARRYGYVYQIAFYQGVLARASTRFEPGHFIVVEKREPFRCGVWRIHRSAIAEARQINEYAIKQLQDSILKNYWPTRYEECRVFDYV